MPTHQYINKTVIVLGDHDTGGQRADMLVGKAAEHRATITEMYTFEPGQPGRHGNLAEVEVVVAAIARALALRTDIWVPFWRDDLGREEHVRRLSLVLQRHGLDLVLGPNLSPCPRTGGINEIDFALRREVRAVADLDHAALAAAALPTLRDDIARALQTSVSPRPQHPDLGASEVLKLIQADFGPYPPLPAATDKWAQRRPALKRFAGWLVGECGLTQTEAAKLLDATGHRTVRGRLWQRSTVAALVNNRSDRRKAA